MHGVVDALDTTFAGIVGKQVEASFTNSGGVKARVMAGESADVAISTAAVIDELARHGKVLPRTVTALARSPIGVAVRAGALRPDIGTVEAFKHALIAAKSIAIADPATGSPSANYLVGLFERMSLTASLRDKLRFIGGGAGGVVVVGEAVVRGDAEIAIQQMPELVGIAGLDVVGELPHELQQVTVFSAAVVATTSDEAGGAPAHRVPHVAAGRGRDPCEGDAAGLAHLMRSLIAEKSWPGLSRPPRSCGTAVL